MYETGPRLLLGQLPVSLATLVRLRHTDRPRLSTRILENEIRDFSCMTDAPAEPSRQCSDNVVPGSSYNSPDSEGVSDLLRQTGPGNISGQGDQVDSAQSTRLQVRHRMMLTREQSFAQVARENQSERTLSFQAWHVAPSPWGGRVPLGDPGMDSLGGHSSSLWLTSSSIGTLLAGVAWTIRDKSLHSTSATFFCVGSPEYPGARQYNIC